MSTPDQHAADLATLRRTLDSLSDPGPWYRQEGYDALARLEAELARLTAAHQDHFAALVAEKEAAEAQVAAMVWFPPPEWKEGWEGLVTAYDYERRYVGCIGRETWDWLLASGITEAQVAALTQERDPWAADWERIREVSKERERLEAAEAEVTRLQEGLRRIADYYEAEFDEGEKAYQAAIAARSLLADKEAG